MNSRIWTLICALLAILSLSACGGGGGGSGTASTDNAEPDEPELVEGEVVFSDKPYQNPDVEAEPDAVREACEATDSYFESENFMVFSSLTTHSEDDLRIAASKAQKAMDTILPKFGMSWSDFYAMKRIVSFSDINQFAVEGSQLTDDQDQPVTVDQYSKFFGTIPDGSSASEQQALIHNKLIEEKNPETVLAVINEVRDGYIADNPESASALSEVTPIHTKIQICALSNDRIGRSSTSGIKIAPEYSDEPYQHESTHFIINQVSKYPAYWAKEGQTHVFLGEDVLESAENVASIRDTIIGTDDFEPTLEDLEKFKIAYTELLKRNDINMNNLMNWHRFSMNIDPGWLTADEEGTGEVISDNERKAGIKEAFGIVMPITYDEFFDNL